MPAVKYVGPHEAVDLPGFGTVAHGATVEVPASVAKSLADQPSNWSPVARAPKTRASKKAAPAPTPEHKES